MKAFVLSLCAAGALALTAASAHAQGVYRPAVGGPYYSSTAQVYISPVVQFRPIVPPNAYGYGYHGAPAYGYGYRGAPAYGYGYPGAAAYGYGFQGSNVYGPTPGVGISRSRPTIVIVR